ncbi:MAG: DNA-binding response regulator [Anaerolineae bacterium]|nr:MAG: DNA-binding response regulator [Anaerolineae bacterium]
MTNVIRIVIIDDHPLYREGVAATLRRDPHLQVVAEGETAEDALILSRQHRPDILLLDLGIPGNGLQALKQIQQEGLPVRVVVLTASDLEEDVVAALKYGALGYVVKGVLGRELVSILKGVAAGQSYIAPNLAARLLTSGYREPKTRPAPFATLTQREREILHCLTNGCNNKEIAEQLHLSEKTVKHYISSILKKLNVRNRVEAALMAQKAGLFE